MLSECPPAALPLNAALVPVTATATDAPIAAALSSSLRPVPSSLPGASS